MAYTVSKYTFFLDFHNKFFTFSSLTKALLRIDKDTYDYLIISQNQHTNIIDSYLPKNVIRVLLDNRIICLNNDLEQSYCHSIIRSTRNISTFQHITIAPTMDCCFSCYYCFEKNKSRTYISTEIIDGIVKYIISKNELERLHLTWFGGEPLMAIDRMVEFYKKLKLGFRGQYSSDIITTGYHLNDCVIQKLKEIEVTEIQITLDGLPERHNKIKHIKGCSDVFNQTILNIDKLFVQYPEIRVCVRINLTKENAHEYSTLYKFLHHRYSGNRISVSPGFVIDTGLLHKCETFTHDECAEFSLSLWENEHIPTPWILINKKDTECAIRNINSIAIDAEGYFYKCWEKISSPKHRFAKINQNGEVKLTDIEVLNRALNDSDPLKDSGCSECEYLPLCFGGCPMRRIEKSIDNCTSYKNNLQNWLIAYMQLKGII